jgi:riboflavin kinase/FMN adenylyltransferase
MHVEEELAQFKPRKDMFLSIGVFDGVHLGHRHLISKLVKLAHKQELLSGVVTFSPHPRELLSPKTRLSYLTTVSERENLLKNEGVDLVVTLSFTHELARLTAREFVILLQKQLNMKGLVIGPDFALGKNREGNIDTLHTLGEELGFSVTVVSPEKINGEVVSSTAIRNALAEGDVPKATRLLGHPFSLQGKVTRGDHRGTGMGFPTANLDVNAKQAIPLEGVYASWAYVEGKKYQAVTNIGRRPTFGDNNERTIESYMLNYNHDLYGKEVKIEIIQRLRAEKRFDDIEELKKQITQDVKQGTKILDAHCAQ